MRLPLAVLLSIFVGQSCFADLILNGSFETRIVEFNRRFELGENIGGWEVNGGNTAFILNNADSQECRSKAFSSWKFTTIWLLMPLTA